MKFKIIAVSLLIINISNVFSQESRSLAPSYLPDKQFSFGAITVGKKMPSLTKTKLNNKEVYVDSYSTQYSNDDGIIQPFSCKKALLKSEEYKQYTSLKTELTEDEFNNINYSKQLFKWYSIKKSSNDHSGYFITDINNNVVEYDTTKKYKYVPDIETMLPKINKIFGTPTVVKKEDPNSLFLIYGAKQVNGMNRIRLMSSMLSMVDPIIDLGNEMDKTATVNTVKVDRSNNSINYFSINIYNTFSAIVDFNKKCIQENKLIYLDLIKKEEEHNKKESETFTL